jgi:hypothetical protein
LAEGWRESGKTRLVAFRKFAATDAADAVNIAKLPDLLRAQADSGNGAREAAFDNTAAFWSLSTPLRG